MAVGEDNADDDEEEDDDNDEDYKDDDDDNDSVDYGIADLPDDDGSVALTVHSATATQAKTSPSKPDGKKETDKSKEGQPVSGDGPLRKSPYPLRDNRGQGDVYHIKTERALRARYPPVSDPSYNGFRIYRYRHD